MCSVVIVKLCLSCHYGLFVYYPHLWFISAYANRKILRAGAALGKLGHGIFDLAVFKRMEGYDRQSAAGL